MVVSTACGECASVNEMLGLVDGGCRPGCPNMFGRPTRGESVSEALGVPLVTVGPGEDAAAKLEQAGVRGQDTAAFMQPPLLGLMNYD